MEKRLTENEIKKIIKDTKKPSNLWWDETDLAINQLIDLYEKKEISEDVLKLYLSYILVNQTKKTISLLTSDLLKNSIGIQNKNSDKVFFVNYSKQSYA